MQSRKALKPSLKPLSRSGFGKEPVGPVKEPTGSTPAEPAGATASVTLNTAYTKV